MSHRDLDPKYELTDEDAERIMARYEFEQLLLGHIRPSYEVAEMESRRWLAENLPGALLRRGQSAQSGDTTARGES